MWLYGRLGRNFKRQEDMGEKLQLNSCSGGRAPSSWRQEFYAFLQKIRRAVFGIHLKFVERKIACAVSILNQLKRDFLKEILLQLYHVSSPTLCNSHMGFYGTYKSNLHKMSIFQNKAVKIVIQSK